ncbi:hypothetical protein G6O69_27765 [Pseudenhygromyxa sp. WMMC2535]|uniref:hypothetical protein n=1 Tax=Pseudenhygromyxa sp. WMMC2535 TaxID=2712867 RepID=UPI0015551161|nr:hypothetical protein [Pseudenhygromyxa sp. WMMC2535]NVB41667.1 hypothetical protein [Pseudenhygromyxa sp. WMMC2535]
MSQGRIGQKIPLLSGLLLLACPVPEPGEEDSTTTDAEGSSSGGESTDDTTTGDTTTGDTDTSDDEDDTQGETEGMGEPQACPVPKGLPTIEIDGADDICAIPEVRHLILGTEGGPEVWAERCMDDEGDSWQDIQIWLPNNNWIPYFNPHILSYEICREVHFHTEPDGEGGCKVTRMDVIDLDEPELPMYSVGVTGEKLSAAGLEITPTNPAACESDCEAGTVYDLAVEAGGVEVLLEADGAPWVPFEVGEYTYNFIRFDALSFEGSDAEGCEDSQTAEYASWAMVRAPEDFESGPIDGGGSGNDPDMPGACLGEVDDPQADSFVGDGVVDATLVLHTVAAEAPVELELGARLHLQGTAFDCCDDDVSVDESVVVRTYPEERFLLAQVASWRTVEPYAESTFFTAIDSDPETWLRPFEISAYNDLICNSIHDESAVKSRLRVHVDGGECETAKIMDESSGTFAEKFFVLAGDVYAWTPDGGSVDTTSKARVFISRQDCAPGECPETTEQFYCPAEGQWPEDRVSVAFSTYFEPEPPGYDLVCEIVDIIEVAGLTSLVEEEEEEEEEEEVVDKTIRYALDCGELCVPALTSEQVASAVGGSPGSSDEARLVGTPVCP